MKEDGPKISNGSINVQSEFSQSSVELGCYASDLDGKDYQKVPPELSEIEENESNSNSMTFLMTLSRKE